jgi:hypothetical protein
MTQGDQMANHQFQIRIKGHLDDHWSDWLGGLTFVRQPDGTTTLSGEIVDRAALYGVLNKLQDMGLTLISVNEVEQDSMSPQTSD